MTRVDRYMIMIILTVVLLMMHMMIFERFRFNFIRMRSPVYVYRGLNFILCISAGINRGKVGHNHLDHHHYN